MNQRLLKVLALVAACLFVVLTPIKLYSADEGKVNIKIVAMNPSSKLLSTVVMQSLPSEIKLEDVVDNAGGEIKYDDSNKCYLFQKKIELEPKETKTIVIKVKNVWTITDEEIAKIKDLLEKNTTALESTKYKETAGLLYEKISGKISKIEEDQALDVGIQKRIELYRAHIQELNGIKQDVLSLNSLREMDKEKETGVRTAKFIIVAENPAGSPKTLTVRNELPAGITANDVIDKLDFLLLFDEKKKRFSLEKKDSFNAKETKKYEITLKDIWFIPQPDLDYLKEQTDKLLKHLKGSSYEKYSIQQGDLINENLTAISDSQELVKDAENIQEKIKAFEVNKEKLAFVKMKVKELQDLMLEIPLKKKIDEIEKIKQAIKKITKLFEILQLGFQPNLSTTWWIILGIIAFLAIISTSFYVTWLTKLRETKSLKDVAKAKAKPKEQVKPDAPAVTGEKGDDKGVKK